MMFQKNLENKQKKGTCTCSSKGETTFLSGDKPSGNKSGSASKHLKILTNQFGILNFPPQSIWNDKLFLPR